MKLTFKNTIIRSFAPLSVLLSALISSSAVAAKLSKEEIRSQVSQYNYVLGTQAIGGHYQLTNDNPLVEQAKQVKRLGSNIMKISLGRGSAKRYQLSETADKSKSVLEFVKSTPEIQQVLNMEFKYYQAWVHSLTDAKWGNGVDKKEAKIFYQEMYDLAEYLLTEFSGTGKTFMLGNWEGDWLLHKKKDRDSVPSQQRIEGMTDWINIRQQAIDDAKKNVKHQNVQLYHYLEVNLVKKALEGKASVAYSVLPKTNVDLVSYSSYEAIKDSKKPNIESIRKPLTEIVNYLEGQLKPKEKLPFSRRVFIGEYGYHADKKKQQSLKHQYVKSKMVAQVAIELDMPFALIWQMYNNEYTSDGVSKEMSLIDESGQKRWLYYLHKVYNKRMKYFVAESLKKKGKVPTQKAFKARAVKVLKSLNLYNLEKAIAKLEKEKKDKAQKALESMAAKLNASSNTEKKKKLNRQKKSKHKSSGPSLDGPFDNQYGFKSNSSFVKPNFHSVPKSFDNINVLVVMSDQHKKSATGAYGHPFIKTPNLDALAADGVLFNNAYTPAPVCALARAAMQTGIYPYANGAIYHKAPYDKGNGKEIKVGAGEYRETGYHQHLTTLADMFKSKGYITAAPGKMHVHGELQQGVDPAHVEGNDMGYDETSLRYYTHFPGKHYEDEVGQDAYHRYAQKGQYKKLGGPQDLNWKLKPSLVEKEEDNFDMAVANKAVKFINQRGKDKQNFFLHVGFEKPHLPLTTLQKYYDMYDYEDFSLPATVNDWYENGRYPWIQDWVHNAIPKRDPEQAKRVMAAYAACITEMDDMFGRLITALKQNGLYDNTIIVYSTDHGEHMFEHGLRGKHNMYEAAVNIPFIVSYPQKLPKGAVNSSIVSLIDVLPTLAELIGSKVSSEVQGISLVETMTTDRQLADRAVFAEYRQGGYKAFSDADYLPSRMMRKGDYKFVYTHGIIDQLYNMKIDPDELNNLALDPLYKNLVKQYQFETIADWRFERYSPLEIKTEGNRLSWTKLSQAKSYNLFYSESPDASSALLIKQDIKEPQVDIAKPGFYWVTADFKFTRTTERLGDIPVWIENHTHRLPVSNVIELKQI